jgi:hypothetical protein
MSTHKHIPRQVLQSAYAMLDKLPPLKTRKEPGVAAVAGFALGGLGLGLYFGSMTDFLLQIFIWICFMVFALPTGGVLLITAPVFCAIYGYSRAKASNAKLEGRNGAILEAEIGAQPPTARVGQKILPGPVQSQMQRLDELLREGILTPSEHAQKRAQLLQQT